MKNKKLIIVGDSAFAEIAYEYYQVDSDFEVVAFSVERNFLQKTMLFGLPIVPYEDLEKIYDPNSHYVYVATVYTQLNRLRTRLALSAKTKGYRLASYVSSRAFIWRNVTLGEHCFIFEDNTVQPYAKIGNNVVLWSGNHIGHHAIIGDNCFLASHVVVSGFCHIGDNSFLGVNAALANNVTIGKDNWLGPNTTILKNTSPDTLFKTEQTLPARVSATRFFKIKSS